MAKVIKVTLGNIGDAIRQVEEYERELKSKVAEFLNRLMQAGVDIASAKILELGAIDRGELDSSLQYTLYREGEKGIVFTDCAHACYVEFGTGIKGSESPHPELPWEYDINGHGEEGWYYYDTDSGRIRFTKGLPSRPFMYETARELEKKAVSIAKEVFAQ